MKDGGLDIPSVFGILPESFRTPGADFPGLARIFYFLSSFRLFFGKHLARMASASEQSCLSAYSRRSSISSIVNRR